MQSLNRRVTGAPVQSPERCRIQRLGGWGAWGSEGWTRESEGCGTFDSQVDCM